MYCKLLVKDAVFSIAFECRNYAAIYIIISIIQLISINLILYRYFHSEASNSDSRNPKLDISF